MHINTAIDAHAAIGLEGSQCIHTRRLYVTQYRQLMRHRLPYDGLRSSQPVAGPATGHHEATVTQHCQRVACTRRQTQHTGGHEAGGRRVEPFA